MFFRVKHLHFVGIGGIGMSGIAEVLLNQGFRITGSDLQDSDILARLQELGAEIAIGHRAENVGKAQVVVYSSAVRPENAEMQEARRLNLPIIPRAEMLGELMRMKYGIAVAGTHGKTTTTSMIGAVMTEAELEPTIIVGGRVKSLATNAVLGSGEFLVAEADEFDRSFLRLTPVISVITTLEAEHMDCYQDFDDIKSAFLQFAEQVPFYGSVIACSDEPGVAELIPRIRRAVVSYGLNEKADVHALAPTFEAMKTKFSAQIHGRQMGDVEINLPGLHNVKNALAALAVAHELGIPFETVQRGLAKFRGVERRFEIKGEYRGVMVVDDYAHHPTEIKATLAAAKRGWDRRIIAVFQPHLYTRTRDFAADFGDSFKDADLLIVTEIYAAREQPIPGVNGKLVIAEARRAGHPEARYRPDKNAIADELAALCRSGDMVITLGAGDVWKVARDLCQKLQEKS
jgi:UDP-N-acetylmuramate--alanine ligase